MLGDYPETSLPMPLCIGLWAIWHIVSTEDRCSLPLLVSLSPGTSWKLSQILQDTFILDTDILGGQTFRCVVMSQILKSSKVPTIVIKNDVRTYTYICIYTYIWYSHVWQSSYVHSSSRLLRYVSKPRASRIESSVAVPTQFFLSRPNKCTKNK